MPHVTEKELLAISDDLLEHEVAIEKCACYLRETNDSEIQSMLQRHQSTMQRHYQELRNFTQGRAAQGGTDAAPAHTRHTGGHQV